MKLAAVVNVVNDVDVNADLNVKRSPVLARTRGASLLGSVVSLGLGLGLILPGVASAGEGIDLSQPAEVTAEGECPRLIQIKYPFLDCGSGQIGMADGDDTWENSRQIPLAFDWVEGDGYFGPDLNQD